jgi:hypothetical protein
VLNKIRGLFTVVGIFLKVPNEWLNLSTGYEELKDTRLWRVTLFPPNLISFTSYLLLSMLKGFSWWNNFYLFYPYLEGTILIAGIWWGSVWLILFECLSFSIEIDWMWLTVVLLLPIESLMPFWLFFSSKLLIKSGIYWVKPLRVKILFTGSSSWASFKHDFSFLRVSLVYCDFAVQGSLKKMQS